MYAIWELVQIVSILYSTSGNDHYCMQALMTALGCSPINGGSLRSTQSQRRLSSVMLGGLDVSDALLRGRWNDGVDVAEPTGAAITTRSEYLPG